MTNHRQINTLPSGSMDPSARGTQIAGILIIAAISAIAGRQSLGQGAIVNYLAFLLLTVGYFFGAGYILASLFKKLDVIKGETPTNFCITSMLIGSGIIGTFSFLILSTIGKINQFDKAIDSLLYETFLSGVSSLIVVLVLFLRSDKELKKGFNPRFLTACSLVFATIFIYINYILFGLVFFGSGNQS